MSLTIRILLILVSLINVVLVRGNLQVISGDVSSSNSHFADSEESSKQRILNNIFPTTIDEQELVYSYNGVPCDECNEFYDGPCPLHVLKHVQARANIPFSYMHHRAARTAPKKILQLEESSIPGGGMGVYTVKKIPKGVVIGPLEGKIIRRDPRNNTNEPEYDLDGKKVNKEDCSADKGNYWQIPGSDNQYVDLLDKSKANFMAYINCARNNREENLIRYFNETDQKFYFKAKIVIPKYTELLVDYGPEFRKTIGINDVDYQRPRTLRNRGLVCRVCKKIYYNIGYLNMHHQNACRYEYEKLVEGAKQKPHIVYRRGRYKMVQFRQWITKEEKTTTADWREFYYDVDMDK